jgi:hypothetical protein
MLNSEGLHSDEPLPSVRVEHELRYRSAGALIAGAAVWCDLGCGSGLAAAAVLEGQVARAVLVDREETLAESAASRVPSPAASALVADLTVREDLDRVRGAVLDGDGPRVVTCFETLERLTTFVPLLELLTELAEQHETTVVLSVPDDEAAPQTRWGGSVWGRGAFEELRRALPGEVVMARQATLAGSVVVAHRADEPGRVDLPLGTTVDESARTHVLAAFGPQAGALAPAAAVVAVDAVAERAALRRREAQLAHDAVALRELQAEADELRARVRALETGAAERPALHPAG